MDGQFTHIVDDDAYEANGETIEWWANHLDARQVLEYRIQELREKHGDEIDGTLQIALDGIEFNDAIGVSNAALDEAFGA